MCCGIEINKIIFFFFHSFLSILYELEVKSKYIVGVQRRRAQQLAAAAQSRRGAAGGPVPAAVAGVLRHGARRQHQQEGPAEPLHEPRARPLQVADQVRAGESLRQGHV